MSPSPPHVPDDIFTSFFHRDSLTGITLNRPIRTSSKSPNPASALTSLRLTGRASRSRPRFLALLTNF